MATLDSIRNAARTSVDPVTGLVTQSDVEAVKGTSIQVAEVLTLNPPVAELFDGSQVELTARLVGATAAVGDLVIVLKVARWFIVLGEVEAI
jgi:hypothetical protein